MSNIGYRQKKQENPEVAFILRGLPKYRFPLFQRLYDRGNLNFRIFCNRFNIPADIIGFSEPDSYHNVPVTPAPTSNFAVNFNRKFRIPLPSLKIYRNLKYHKPDIAIFEPLSNLGTDLICTPFLLKKKIPFIWWSLGAIPGRNAGMRSKIGDLVQSWYVKHANAVFAYSSHAKKILESLGADPDYTFNVFNTLDEKAILHSIKDCRPLMAQLKVKLGVEDKMIIVFSGTINRTKRLDLLIKALKRTVVIMQNTAPVLIVIGDGEDLERCKNLSRSLGLKENIIFVGRQEKLASAYLLMGNLMVLPGLGGLAINHAFVHSLPVICGNADGCEVDLVQNYHTGMRLDTMNEQELADTLVELLHQPDLIREMGENAYQLITETITLDNYAETIEFGVFKALDREVIYD